MENAAAGAALRPMESGEVGKRFPRIFRAIASVRLPKTTNA